MTYRPKGVRPWRRDIAQAEIEALRADRWEDVCRFADQGCALCAEALDRQPAHRNATARTVNADSAENRVRAFLDRHAERGVIQCHQPLALLRRHHPDNA